MKHSILILFALLLLNGCTEKSIEQKTEAKILAPIKELQKEYAPDKRVAVFNIKAYELGNKLIVVGDVEKEDAKKELFDLLTAEKKEIVDSVIVL